MSKIFLEEWINSSEEAKAYCATLLDISLEEMEVMMLHYLFESESQDCS